jgi:uncharacterized protein involved in exopolysaccharide biosynthesis
MGEERKVELIDYLRAAAKHRGKILRAVGGGTLLALLLTFIMPFTYRATAVVLPPPSTSAPWAISRSTDSGSARSRRRSPSSSPS